MVDAHVQTFATETVDDFAIYTFIDEGKVQVREFSWSFVSSVSISTIGKGLGMFDKLVRVFVKDSQCVKSGKLTLDQWRNHVTLFAACVCHTAG